MRLLKALILLLIFMGTAESTEPISKPFELDSVLITFFWYDTLAELNEAFPDDEGRLSGYSECEHYLDHNLAHCDIYVVRPQIVDGEHSLTLGHEVLHGVHGPRYHKEVE